MAKGEDPRKSTEDQDASRMWRSSGRFSQALSVLPGSQRDRLPPRSHLHLHTQAEHSTARHRLMGGKPSHRTRWEPGKFGQPIERVVKSRCVTRGRGPLRHSTNTTSVCSRGTDKVDARTKYLGSYFFREQGMIWSRAFLPNTFLVPLALGDQIRPVTVGY